MNKFLLAISNRAFVTVLIGVLIAVLPVVRNFLTPAVFTLVEGVVVALAGYFGVNPTPSFTAKLKQANYGI